eukprot:350535-Chlamydomonas_euryale.AAC.3
MAHRLTRLYEEGKVTHEQASLVKAWNTQRAREVCALGREVLGGNGIVTDYGVAKVCLCGRGGRRDGAGRQVLGGNGIVTDYGVAKVCLCGRGGRRDGAGRQVLGGNGIMTDYGVAKVKVKGGGKGGQHVYVGRGIVGKWCAVRSSGGREHPALYGWVSGARRAGLQVQAWRLEHGKKRNKLLSTAGACARAHVCAHYTPSTWLARWHAQAFCDVEAFYSYEGTYDVNALVAGRGITGVSAFKTTYGKK